MNISQPTLAAALSEVARLAEARGRLVGDVLADGARLTDDQLQGAGAAAFQELICTTIDPYELVVSTLRDSVEALTATARDQQSVAEQIQAGKTGEAMEMLGPILATWQVVQQVVDQGGTAIRVDLRTVAVPGIDDAQPVQRCGDALRNSLLELKRALSDEDWPAVSDIVGYDLDAHARDWRSILRGLAEFVESRRASGRAGGGA